jgi:hypothetical protein
MYLTIVYRDGSKDERVTPSMPVALLECAQARLGVVDELVEVIDRIRGREDIPVFVRDRAREVGANLYIWIGDGRYTTRVGGKSYEVSR